MYLIRFLYLLVVTNACFWKRDQLTWWGLDDDMNVRNAFRFWERDTRFTFTPSKYADILVTDTLNNNTLTAVARGIGKILGLNVSSDPRSIMHPQTQIYYNSTLDEIDKRALENIYLYGRPCTVRYDAVAMFNSSTLLVLNNKICKIYNLATGSVSVVKSKGYPIQLSDGSTAWIEDYLLKMPDRQWIDLLDLFRQKITVGVTFNKTVYLFTEQGRQVYIINEINVNYAQKPISLVFDVQTPGPIVGAYPYENQWLILVADEQEWIFDKTGHFVSSRYLSNMYPTVFCKNICHSVQYLNVSNTSDLSVSSSENEITTSISNTTVTAISLVPKTEIYLNKFSNATVKTSFHYILLCLMVITVSSFL